MSESSLKPVAIDKAAFRQPFKRRIRFALRDAAAMMLLPVAQLDSRNARFVSILSYHRILPDFPAGSSRSGNVSPHDFVNQICFLLKQQYEILTLDQFRRIHSCEMQPPAKAAMITFDDGYADNFAVAHEIGKRMGAPINYFISSGIIGLPEWPYDWDERTPQELWHMNRYPEMWRPLTWDEVHRMRREGAHFGLHGYMHQRLSGLAREGLAREIGEGITRL